MSSKSKHKSKGRAKAKKTVSQPSLKSSWGGAVVSFLKEFWLDRGVGGYHHNFDEDLNDEGLWKKKLIWASQLLIMAVVLAVFPFYRKEAFAAESAPTAIFTFFIFEVTAIGMGIGGIVKIKKAIRIRSKTKEEKDKGNKAKN